MMQSLQQVILTIGQACQQASTETCVVMYIHKGRGRGSVVGQQFSDFFQGNKGEQQL